MKVTTKKMALAITGFLLLLAFNGSAQAPNSFKYQAVVRDAEGNIIKNEQVNLTISILQGSVNGSPVFEETHDSTTNAFGLVTLNIGAGNQTGFKNIDWHAGPYFIKIEKDDVLLGTSQLLSVPYAKHAERSDTATQTLLTYSDGTKYYLAVDGGNVIAKLQQCPDSLTDYDGNTYGVVKIGEQCWMAENLRTTHYADGTPVLKVTGNTEWYNLDTNDKAYCWYNNDSASNAQTYGALYTWAAAMNGAASSNSNPSGVQGVCPDGWHLPSDAEWDELANYLGGDTIAGGKLKETGTIHWNPPNLGATNETGFTALPGGYRDKFDGLFYGLKGIGNFWSATEYDLNSAVFFRLNYNFKDLFDTRRNMQIGHSVRCVKN